MEYLKEQEREQKELRARYAVFKRGPRIPLEIIKNILSLIPAINRVELGRGDDLHVYVDGLLPYTVISPPQSLPHYDGSVSPACTLLYFDNEDVKPTVLKEALLTNSIKLHALLRDDTYSMREHPSDLLPLSVFPHRLGLLYINTKSFSMRDFIRLFESCLSRLEVLHVCIRGNSDTETSSDVVPLSSNTLKKVLLDFTAFKSFFNTGILLSITNLH